MGGKGERGLRWTGRRRRARLAWLAPDSRAGGRPSVRGLCNSLIIRNEGNCACPSPHASRNQADRCHGLIARLMYVIPTARCWYALAQVHARASSCGGGLSAPVVPGLDFLPSYLDEDLRGRPGLEVERETGPRSRDREPEFFRWFSE